MGLTKEDIDLLQQRLKDNELFQSLPEPARTKAVSESLEDIAHELVRNTLDSIEWDKKPKRKPRAKKAPVPSE